MRNVFILIQNKLHTCTSLSKEDRSKPSQMPRGALIFCKSLNSTTRALIVPAIGVLGMLEGYLEMRYQNRRFSQGTMELRKYGSPKMKLISDAFGKSSTDLTILTRSVRPFSCTNIFIVVCDREFSSSKNIFAPNFAAARANKQPSERQRQTVSGVIFFRKARTYFSLRIESFNCPIRVREYAICAQQLHTGIEQSGILSLPKKIFN